MQLFQRTKRYQANLPERQKNVYQLVATRFLCIFLPAEVRDETTAFITIGEHSFRAKGVVIKDPGGLSLSLKPTSEEGERQRCCR